MKAIQLAISMMSLLLAISAFTQVLPSMTHDSAIARADKFFNSVHWKWTGAEEVKSPVQYGALKNRWEITSNSYRVQIDCYTGDIMFAIHDKALNNRKDAIVNISEKGTLPYVDTYLKAANISINDLRLDYVHLRVDNEQNGNKFWDLCYDKSYNTYHYYGLNNVVLISVDPVDGSLISFDNPGQIPAPLALKLVISKDEAISIAKKYFANNNITIGELESTSLKIVLPNNTWQYITKQATNYQEQLLSALAWVINFTGDTTDTKEIWVNASSGDIIGGPISMVRIENPAISEDSAIRRLISCLADLHWSFSDMNITPPDRISYSANNRWILNSDSYEMKIDSTNGIIRYIVNYHNLYNKDKQQNISKEQALHYAEKYLNIIGISLQDIHLVYIYIEQTASSLPGYWEACFCPSFHGYDFSFQNNITMGISAVNGDLISIGNPGNIPNPKSVNLKLNAEEAMNAATALFATKNDIITFSNKPKLLIVLPNYYWNKILQLDTVSDDETNSRLAWILSINKPWKGYIWIDAANGSMLGGDAHR